MCLAENRRLFFVGCTLPPSFSGPAMKCISQILAWAACLAAAAAVALAQDTPSGLPQAWIDAKLAPQFMDPLPIYSPLGTVQRVSVHPDTGLHIDSAGRQRTFRGLNAVYKVAPFLPVSEGFDTTSTLSEADAALLSFWGFNNVRLGVLWEATMPMPGMINQSYIQAARDMVDMLADHGVWSIVDAHQDLVNAAYCGEGVPSWLLEAAMPADTPQFPEPMFWIHIDTDPATGLPNMTQCQEVHPFSLLQGSAAINVAWGQMTQNASVIRAFATHWGAVAEAMRMAPGAAWFDLINEPWIDGFKYPLGFFNGTLADGLLMQMYKPALAAIRATGNRGAIVMSERMVAQQFTEAHTGFPRGLLNPNDTQQAFGYHVYCVNQDASGEIDNLQVCYDTMAAGFKLATADAAAVGVGSFLSEYGAVSNGPNSTAVLQRYADIADEQQLSISYWSYKAYHDITTQNAATETLFNPDGSIQMSKLAALSRPYPPVIAGDMGASSWHFDTTTRIFTMNYTVSATAANLTSVIYLNEALYYPTGFRVDTVPAGAALVYRPFPNYLGVGHIHEQRGLPMQVILKPM